MYSCAECSPRKCLKQNLEMRNSTTENESNRSYDLIVELSIPCDVIRWERKLRNAQVFFFCLCFLSRIRRDFTRTTTKIDDCTRRLEEHQNETPRRGRESRSTAAKLTPALSCFYSCSESLASHWRDVTLTAPLWRWPKYCRPLAERRSRLSANSRNLHSRQSTRRIYRQTAIKALPYLI